MQVRLTRKLADRFNDVDLTRHVVGDVLDLPTASAEMLIEEGWAVPFDPAARREAHPPKSDVAKAERRPSKPRKSSTH
jgi:hypothetical protein